MKIKLDLVVLVHVALWAALPTANLEAQEAIFVVRHAEKVDDSDDPPLSAEGESRARALARHLRDVGVDAIYSTGFIRTMNTAQPLADELGIDVVTEPAHDLQAVMSSDGALAEYLDALVSRLRRLHEHDVVLVAGHSNTVPDLLAALGHPEPITIASEEYDNLFLLIPRPDGPPTLLRLRY